MRRVWTLLLFFWCTTTVLAGWAMPGETADTFDHAAFDRVLQSYVHDGKVDYAGLKSHGAAQLDQYLAALAQADPDKLSGDSERLAFWLNAYNACALKAVLDGISTQSRATRHHFFTEMKFQIAHHATNLDDIENVHMGPLFKQPRTHFGLVCSTVGSPPLRAHAYTGATVDNDLDEAAKAFVGDPNRVRFDAATHVLYVSPIFEWYKADFESNGRSLTQFLKPYLPADTAQALDAGPVEIKYMDYDWSLNGSK